MASCSINYILHTCMLIGGAMSLYASEYYVKPSGTIVYGIGANTHTNKPDLITLLACQHQPDIIATQTIRSGSSHCIPGNIRPLIHITQLTHEDLKHPLLCTSMPLPDNSSPITLAHFADEQAEPCAYTEDFIQNSMRLLKEHAPQTKLMLSVYGDSTEEFEKMARMTKELGVHYVCAHLSYPYAEQPRLLPLYKDPEAVSTIVQHMQDILKGTPLVLKIGIFAPEETDLMEQVLLIAAKHKVYAIYGIDAVKASVIKKQENQGFISPENSPSIGYISGTGIRSLAFEWVLNARSIIAKHNLPLFLWTCGGISTSEDFKRLEPYIDGAFAASAIYNHSFKFPPKEHQNMISKL